MSKSKKELENQLEIESQENDNFDEKSLEIVEDNVNNKDGKEQLVTKRFVKCWVDVIKHEGQTYKRWDEISMKASVFASLQKYKIKFEDL